MTLSPAPPTRPAPTPTPADARALARDACIYGFPLVDSYRIQHSYFVDRSSPEFKADWNQLFNNARVYTPEDRAIQTPNSDTPYSFVGADLRAEPLVFTVPVVEHGRYFSLQFIDQYTFNFAYVGSRSTGNEGGVFLLAGPRWTGVPPTGITAVIRCDTDYAFVLFRTQLFDAADIEKVRKVQAGYKVQTLSAFLGASAPPPVPAVQFVTPLTPDQQRTSPDFFNVLNFVLQFCPVDSSETGLMARFNTLGVGAGLTFDLQTLAPELQQAVKDGMADAWATFEAFKKREVDTGNLAGQMFGTRAFLKNDYLVRMAAAVLGIYGNSKDEAWYLAYFVDSDGEKPDGTKKRYILRFAPGELPPVNAFWSLTLYELPSSLLSANPLNRYLINSPMLPSLRTDPDNGITLYIQHASPGADKVSNWLPAPDGPFFMVLRLYWPTPQVLEGRWRQPPLQAVT